MDLMNNAKIFEPYHRNGIELVNRMVMAPMTRSVLTTWDMWLLN